MKNTPTQELLTDTDGLTAQGLIDVAEGRIKAILVPNYYPAELCAIAASRLVAHPRFGFYGNAKDIGRVGMSYFEATVSDELANRYYDQASGDIEELRRVFCPHYSPLDWLRLELQEKWAPGASLMSLDGRPMFVGLARVFSEGAEALPHQDILRRDAPFHLAAHELTTQLAANIYLQPSDAGGDLDLWSFKPSDAEYNELRLGTTYGLDRDKLPAPCFSMKPSTGDLIIFNSTHAHAVRSIQGRPRVSISCFIGYRGRNKSLSYWS